MQVFVPFQDTRQIAECLDNKRLNKQLLEGRQLLNINASGRTKGAWVNHPAAKMVRGYEGWFYDYLKAMKRECNKRGIETINNWNAINDIRKNANVWNWEGDPLWWGDQRVHDSHKANLYRKDPIHYFDFSETINNPCCSRCLYYWPVSNHAVEYDEKYQLGRLIA
jgi:hypothetical protein